jgi:hypothetical protein
LSLELDEFGMSVDESVDSDIVCSLARDCNVGHTILGADEELEDDDDEP